MIAKNPYRRLKELLGIFVSNEKVVINIPPELSLILNHKKSLMDVLKRIKFKIKGKPVFNLKIYPSDFQIEIDGKHHVNLSDDVFNKPIPIACNFTLIVPNRFNLSPGKYRLSYSFTRGGGAVLFKVPVRPLSEMVKTTEAVHEIKSEIFIDFNIDFNTERVCPGCAKILQLAHNICKYCGKDLSEIKAIGNSSDSIVKDLAISAVTDPSPDVRKEAVDAIGNFGDKNVLGVLTYILLNDPDENVRKKAADELGNLHHPFSIGALSLALKDESSLVRKKAIEGLKKIKKKNE